jgi:peptide chain release factor subunit 1
MPSESTIRERICAVSEAATDDDRLLTLVVAGTDSLGAVREQMEEDRAEAEYIDAGGTSRQQLDALERALRVFRDYERTPEGGLVVYAGAVDGDVVDHVFDDVSLPTAETGYRFANEFDVDPLDAAVSPGGTYGLLVVERGGAALGRLESGRVERPERIDSDVPGKTRAGGQSADRFERERERRKREFFETVGEAAARRFVGASAADADPVDDAGAETTAPDVDGLLLGGTTVTAEQFRDGDYLPDGLADRLLGDPISVEYATEQGLEELAEKGAARVEEVERRGPRETLATFFEELAAERDEEVRYGFDAVAEALEYEAVETALLSEALSVEDIREFEERTEAQGGDVVVVPTDAERGEQFAEAFDGVGAFLRFPLE